ncbi:MAG: OsmC family peroxiredoxin [Nitrospiraceae bacterium]|nr:OsmC family peroxiredoxin [Nitrospiraceae bacterium]
MAVQIDVEYQGDLHCCATHGPSGRTLITDAPTDNGGKGGEFSPTDLVATSSLTCVMTIMGLIARECNLDLTGMRGSVTKKMVADPHRRIGALDMTIAVPNAGSFSEADRHRLEDAGKACPVKQSLRPDVEVRIQFEYIE